MNSLKIITSALILIIIFSSCTKKEIPKPDCPNNAPESGLFGRWNWISTDGGYANNIHETPESTSVSVRIEFTANGHYFIFQNDVLSSEGTYTLTNQTCIHDGTEKQFIDFSGAEDHDLMIEDLDSQQMKLSDNAYDGLVKVFVRE